MTSGTKARERSRRGVKAQVRLIWSECCVNCRAGPESQRLVDIRMPLFPPVGEGFRLVADNADRLVLCELCVSDAARTLGFFRSPELDADVQRLKAASEVAVARHEEALVKQTELQEQIRQLEANVP